MNSIEINIAGQRFELRSDEDLEHVKSVASLVREKIERLSRAQPSMSVQKAAILAAFAFASEQLRGSDRLRQVEQRVEALLSSLETSDSVPVALTPESQPELFEPSQTLI